MTLQCVDSLKVELAGPPADGGSIPTSTLQLRKADWNVAGVDRAHAVALIERIHYAKGVGKQAVAIHGLYPASWRWFAECVGVAWWMPPTKAVGVRLCGDRWEGVLALSRLAIEEDVPANACSFLVSKSVKKLDPRWHTLVSYADSWRGHTGAIYRACGWRYDGLTRPTETWMLNGRMIAMKAGPKTRTVAEMKALGAEFAGRHAKHRYVLQR